MPLSDKQALAGFGDYLRVEKGLAQLSVAAYRRDLEQFAEFLGKRDCPLLRARRQDVRDYLEDLFAREFDSRSVARKLSALRQFYKYALLDRHLEQDPTLDIKSPRQWRVLPKSLARQEVETMLAAGAPSRDTALSAALSQRDQALLEMLYAGGLRVSEMVGAKLEDLKLDLGYILVRGKGDKERIVPLGRAALEAVRTYLEQARVALCRGRSSAHLFVARGRRPAEPPARVATCGQAFAGERPPRQSAHAAA